MRSRQEETMTNRPKLTLGWRGKSTPAPDITFVDVTAPALPPPVLACSRHVIEVSPYQELSGFQICLNHWRDWMQYHDRDLGARGQHGIASGPDEGDRDGYDDSAAAGEAAAARASREIAMATDAMIDSLDRHHKAAIYRSCSIASVWRFPNLQFETALAEAHIELSEKLARNVATRAFF
jgi:hypothetical protein